MSDLDDRLGDELRRLAAGVDGAAAYQTVVRRKRRRRVIRRVQTAVLAAGIVATSAGGVLALTRVFVPDGRRPAGKPVVGPSLTPTVAPSGERCPVLRERIDPGEPIGRSWTAGVVGEGNPALVRLYGDEEAPADCRYFLVVEHSEGDTNTVYREPITVFEWLRVAPAIFTIAEIDGERGLEVVVEFGGPGHPYRTGEVFTFVRDPRFGRGSIERMFLAPSDMDVYAGFPLYGESPAAVDCAGEPGRIVVTTGTFAPGGDDTRYGITRTFYETNGTAFEPVDRRRLTVAVDRAAELWPELADDSFRSCPR